MEFVRKLVKFVYMYVALNLLELHVGWRKLTQDVQLQETTNRSTGISHRLFIVLIRLGNKFICALWKFILLWVAATPTELSL